ncbi:MAG TPA: hypothetical protein VMA09_03615 [Candidatus Binataceae bacterium]|nr:hypothetical protein [Candidatus Binataceae bacterium]
MLSHPSEHRHEYVVKSLGRLPGLLKPHRYVYLCLRCKWTFVVNDGRRGVISAVDHDLAPLPEHQATERLASFGAGPCPSLDILHHLPVRVHRPSPRLALVDRRATQERRPDIRPSL